MEYDGTDSTWTQVQSTRSKPENRVRDSARTKIQILRLPDFFTLNFETATGSRFPVL